MPIIENNDGTIEITDNGGTIISKGSRDSNGHVEWQDRAGAKTGMSYNFGNETTHTDVTGAIIGTSYKSGDQTEHKDSIGRNAGKTIADGISDTEYDPLGVETGKSSSINSAKPSHLRGPQP